MSIHDSSSGLARLGWSAVFQDALSALADTTLAPARVVAEHRDAFEVHDGAATLRAALAGRLRHDAAAREDLPAVGDWVAVQRGAGGAATIRRILPRTSALVRKVAGRRADAQVVAANLDVAFVVTSANQDFNAARLARYLTAVWESGATPVVLVNKSDLADDADAYVSRAADAAPGAAVHAVSAAEGRGLDALGAHLAPGRTAAFVGSSGVGKSSLVNRLLGEERLDVRAVRAHDERGVHTTTARQLIALPSGALVIDTPGMRELLPMDDGEGLAAAFDDVAGLAERCRFRDCRHVDEPGCAVREAVRDGTLPAERLAQWVALGRELAYLRTKEDTQARLEAKRRWKAIGKSIRARDRLLRDGWTTID